MIYEFVDRKDFIKRRWDSYQYAMTRKEKTAREIGCDTNALIIMEPPQNDEIICDKCEQEITEQTVLIHGIKEEAHCDSCYESR